MTLLAGTTLTNMNVKLSSACEQKRKNEKDCFVVVFFVVVVHVVDVSHHHRDSFICLHLDMLEGKS